MTGATRGRARIGVLVPFTNVNLEADLAMLRPDGVSMHFARLGGYDAERTPDDRQMAGLGAAPLDEPLRLIAGTQRVAAGKLDFRFDEKRSDEIGYLEQSFNAMTARIQAHRRELRSAMEYLGGIVENSAAIIITVTFSRIWDAIVVTVAIKEVGNTIVVDVLVRVIDHAIVISVNIPLKRIRDAIAVAIVIQVVGQRIVVRIRAR